MWLDFDFEDGRCQRGGRYSRRKRLPFVVEEAKRHFARYEVNSGQIGLYDYYGGGAFYGYVIKYPGEAPYFEPAPKED